MDLEGIALEGVDWLYGSEQKKEAGFSQHGNEHSSAINCWQIVD